VQSLVVVSHTVCAHVYIGGPQNLGDVGVLSPWDGTRLTPRNTLLPRVLLYQISSLLGVGGISKNWGHWCPVPFGWGMADP